MTKHKVTGITLDAEYQYLVDQLPDVVLIVTDQDMRTVLAGGLMSCWTAGPRTSCPNRSPVSSPGT